MVAIVAACLSMETMRRERIADVLTNDAHFEQGGFRAISGSKGHGLELPSLNGRTAPRTASVLEEILRQK
jgi:hypothetical protein